MMETSNSVHQLKNPEIINPGTLTLEEVRLQQSPTFVDYLKSGWSIKMSAAIDFTASNGDQQDSASLHFINQNGCLNDYEQAITSVGSILESYADKREFAVYGFGGIPNSHSDVSHCFSLTP